MDNKATENNTKLSQTLVKQGASMKPLNFDDAAASWFRDNAKRLKNLAGDDETARKIFLMAINTASKNPMLLQCDFQSFANCILTSCELKLYPGPMQECAYVPFMNNKSGKMEAQFMPMYAGLVKLAYNSGFVRDIQSSVVYEKDLFEFELGTNKFLKHKPFIGRYEDRGQRKCVYGIINTTFGSHIVVKSMEFVENIQARSKAAKTSFSPWNTTEDDYDAMCCKTLFKQAAKFIPKSIELQSAIDSDNRTDGAIEITQNDKPLVDISESVKAALPEKIENAVKQEPKELSQNV